MKRSRLIVSITAPPGDIFFELVLKRPNEAFSEKIVTQKRKLCFELEKGEYQVEIRNGAFLNPMGIIKWIDLKKCNSGQIFACFQYPYCQKEVKTLDFTLTDKYYPDIIEISGGITVCQKIIR